MIMIYQHSLKQEHLLNQEFKEDRDGKSGEGQRHC